MAKSLRSKSKRSFRRVKRENSAFSVAHAVRLERLSAKLAGIKAQPPPPPPVNEDDEEKDTLGWYYSPFSLFGLVDPEDIYVDNIGEASLLDVIQDEV